jgi:branched-chain amino acid transport system permease protein
MADQQRIMADLEDHLWRSTIEPLLNDDLVAEHAQNPFGRHSPELSKVLHCLQRNGGVQRDQYVLIEVQPARAWRIARLSGERQVPPRLDGATIYRSRDEAEHAVFLRRLEDRQRLGERSHSSRVGG